MTKMLFGLTLFLVGTVILKERFLLIFVLHWEIKSHYGGNIFLQWERRWILIIGLLNLLFANLEIESLLIFGMTGGWVIASLQDL